MANHWFDAVDRHQLGRLHIYGRGARKRRENSIPGFLIGCLALAATSILPGAVSGAPSIEAARGAFDEGRFIEAAEIAEAVATSESLALAAESVAIYGTHIAEEDDKQALYVRAMRLAEGAIRLDPNNAEAHAQSAHAMGRYSQTIGTMKAVREGYAGKVREAIERTLELQPDMAAAHASLATWHAEAISTGSFMARALYGASKKGAFTHYQRALELAPEMKAALIEYGRGLLMLQGRKKREEARGLFMRVGEIPSPNAYDRLLDKQALKLLAEIDG